MPAKEGQGDCGWLNGVCMHGNRPIGGQRGDEVVIVLRSVSRPKIGTWFKVLEISHPR